MYEPATALSGSIAFGGWADMSTSDPKSGTHAATTPQSASESLYVVQSVVKLWGACAPTLRAFLDDRLGRHEMPQGLEFTTSLPRTPVGKYSRKMLRDQVLKALDGA